ncbi:acid protease [Gyrodon lividus]|nr:acid protease [Gyrodon lividus]
MFPPKGLLSVLLATLTAADASPLHRETGKATLSFATKVKVTGLANVAAKDKDRAQAMRDAAHLGKRNVWFDVTNAVVTCTAQVSIGSPATDYTLLIDTGSANTWVGSSKAYDPTSTSKTTGETVSITYGYGSFSGEEWLDTVTLAPGLTIPQQSIGVANKSEGFSNFDGILGLGPVDLTQDSVTNTYEVPTVTDNLYSQGTISQEVLGIYYVPASESNSDGELTFGGYDRSVMTHDVNYVPLTITFPASYYWGIDECISYGNTTILSETAGVVDSGTTLILLASDAFNTYQSLTGAIMDETTGLLTITASQYAKLKTLTFNIGGVAYDLIPNAQIFPRSLNTAIGGSASSIYLVVGDIGTPSGYGLDFINGYTFLERYYSVFDTTNGRVGFARTAYTDSTAN